MLCIQRGKIFIVIFGWENRLYEEELHMKKLLSDKDGDTHVISRKMKIRCIIVIISLVLGGIGGWKLNDFINKEEYHHRYTTV